MSVTTTGICTDLESNVGIEGRYKISMFGETVDVDIIKKAEVGMYTLSYDDEGVPETAELKTCLIDGVTYADGLDEDYNTLFKITKANYGLTLSSIVMDMEKLDALGIPNYEEENELGSFTVIIDNKGVSPKDLLSAEDLEGEAMALDLLKY